MSEEIIKNITKSDSNFGPTFIAYHLLLDITFNGHCLIKNRFSVPTKLINLYVFYTLTPWLKNLNTDFTLNNCLCGSD